MSEYLPTDAIGGVMKNQTRDFKESIWLVALLDNALKMEQKKYKKCPVKPDIAPKHEIVQAWGYVVAGYFLVEQSFKALLHLRKKKVPPTHSLTTLLKLLDPADKEILSEFYVDYREVTGGSGRRFPFKTLEDFLENLDGDDNKKGSFAWRYFPIEEPQGRMPVVSTEFLHEVAFGCIRLISYAHDGKYHPSRYTYSWRLQWKRYRKYSHWLTVRMNSKGWDKLGDRLEILWGPDYRGRYDYLWFKGKSARSYFWELPDNPSLLVIDKRKEIESFDVEKGLRSVGVTFSSRPNYLHGFYPDLADG